MTKADEATSCRCPSGTCHNPWAPDCCGVNRVVLTEWGARMRDGVVVNYGAHRQTAQQEVDGFAGWTLMRRRVVTEMWTEA